MPSSAGRAAASGKKVTAMVVMPLIFRKPPKNVRVTVRSLLHLTIMALSLDSKKPMEVSAMHNPEAFQISGSSKRIILTTGEALAAITSTRLIFAMGLRYGQIRLGIFPLVVSLSVTPIIVGITTIIMRERTMPPMSIATFAPISSETVPGTTSGAVMVPNRIRVKQSALSPRNMVTQIKLETAVGPENSRMYPVMVSGLSLKSRVAVNMAHNGIRTWLEI